MIETIPIQIQKNVTKSKTKNCLSNAYLIADIHLGCRKGSDEWQENIQEYFEKFFIPLISKTKDENSFVLCLGDIFDDRNAINIASNNLAISVFEKMAEIMPVYIINGNHDLYKKTHNDITSLRSLDHIPNVYMFKEPTMWTIGTSEWKKNLMMIPYQGDIDKETTLLNQNCTADYIFMHTEIKNLSYDNGMAITMGVDTSSIKGKLYSGHIHKHQKKGNLTYIGSPLELKRSDMGNQKGIYRLHFDTGIVEFYVNDVSPKYKQISLEQINTMTDSELENTITHNYIDLMVRKEDTKKLKINELYEKLVIFKPRKVEIKEIVGANNWSLDEDVTEYKEKSIQEIIEEMIDSIPEMDEKNKIVLKQMNCRFQDIADTEMKE